MDIFYELHGRTLSIREMFFIVLLERVYNSVTFYTLQQHNIMAKKMTRLNFKTAETTAQNKSRFQVTSNVNMTSNTSSFFFDRGHSVVLIIKLQVYMCVYIYIY